MRLKVYLRSPVDVLAPELPSHVRHMLPDVELPDGSTIETLLSAIGVGKARPIVLLNKVQEKGDAALHDRDRVDLVLPIAGG